MTLTDFESAVQQLKGQPCWNIQAGAVGSLINLHLGDKIALEKPLPFPNPSLSPEAHKFRGQYILYIEDCPWRLDGPERVLASWTDDNGPRGPIVTQLRALIGQQVEMVSLSRPGLDLVLTFTGGYTLRIFPDQSDPDAGDNYALALIDRTYIVGARSQLIIE
ncbi:MAG: hypothetical protein OHK0046_04860 [Anaerolineae bacterium]